MDEIRKIPPVTRYLVGGTLAITLPILLQLVAIYPIVFIPSAITKDWEIWRLVTGFGFGGSGIGLLFDTFLLYRNSVDLEERHFQGRTASYTWALILIGGAIEVLHSFFGPGILYRPLLVAITHLWGQTNPTASVSLFGLINVPAPWFSFAMLGMDALNGGLGALIRSATGLVAGHAYYFLTEILPTQSGRPPFGFLSPPVLLVRQLGQGVPPANVGRTGAGGSSTDTGVYRAGGGWGIRPSGNRLGATPGNRAAPAAGAGAAAEARAAGGRGVGTTAREAGAGGATYRWGAGQRLGEE